MQNFKVHLYVPHILCRTFFIYFTLCPVIPINDNESYKHSMNYKEHMPQKSDFLNICAFTFLNKIHKSSDYRSNEAVQTQGTD